MLRSFCFYILMMFFHSTVNSLMTMDMLKILGEKGVGRRAKKVNKNLIYKQSKCTLQI